MSGSYSEGERVLCFHGPLIYEAINKAENWTDGKKHHNQTGPHYYVHYKGWKQTWDEWVPEHRLLKWNEDNLSRQKQLNEAQRAKDRAEREALKAGNLDTSLSAKSAAQTAKANNSAAGGTSSRGTKRNRDAALEEEEFKTKPEIKIVIPDILKVKLVDDWEAITRDAKLVPLPRTPSVATILAEYENSIATAAKPPRSLSLTREVVSGLKLYFDKSLGNNLLYRFERNQYAEIKKKYATLAVGQPMPVESTGGDKGNSEKKLKEMSEIYGVEHLLRLFVNLPELVAHTSMDAETVTVLREALTDILKWIVQESDRLFNVSYEETSIAYQNVSRT